MTPKYNNIIIEIKEQEILFPKGYFFKQSEIHNKGKVTAEDISEINMGIFPHILVFRNQEMIFIKTEYEIQLTEFAQRNNIPIIDRFDIWEHINRPFLDTEFEPEEEIASQKLLAENGISATELKTIRKKIGRTMFINFRVWEWNYLGLYDYLTWTYLTKTKYKWAMEIALRNLKTSVGLKKKPSDKKE